MDAETAAADFAAMIPTRGGNVLMAASGFVKKTCVKCGNLRKYLAGTARDKTGVCGECWDWRVPDAKDLNS